MFMQIRPSMIAIILLIWTCSLENLILGAVCPESCSCSTEDSDANSRTVKCSYLDFSVIPEMLHADTVYALDLSNNKISILRNTSFSSYSRLLRLILSNNEVEEIEISTFVGLGMMRVIDLSYNNLRSFNPEIFSSNPVLENVSLKGNRIAYLSSSSPILISNSISSLDLSSCFVTTIHPVTFSRLPKLYFLDLSSNLLQTISVNTFQKLPDLAILELNNNHWTCNCDIIEVIQWAESRREQQPDHNPVKCLEGQQYRILWARASGNKSCRESKTTEPVVVRDREFTTDLTIALSNTSDTTSHQVTENGEKNDGINLVFYILVFFVGAFVSFIVVKYVLQSANNHRTQPDNQGNEDDVSSANQLPLLELQPTTERNQTQGKRTEAVTESGRLDSTGAGGCEPTDVTNCVEPPG